MSSSDVPTSLPSPSLKKERTRDSLAAASVHVSSFSSCKQKPLVVRRVASFTPGKNSKGGKATVVIGGGARAKLISFQKEPQVVGEIPARSEISEEDIANTWYSKDEFKEMKALYISIVKKIAKKLEFDENEDPRGLEHKTPRGNKTRQKNRFQAMDAVLDEQDRQWENERKDPEYIAQIYRQSSAHCQMNAYLIAKKDAEFVDMEVREKEDRDLEKEETKEEQEEAQELKEREEEEAVKDNDPPRSEGVFPSKARVIESPTTPVRKQPSKLCAIAVPEVLSPQLLAAVAR